MDLLAVGIDIVVFLVEFSCVVFEIDFHGLPLILDGIAAGFAGAGFATDVINFTAVWAFDDVSFGLLHFEAFFLDFEVVFLGDALFGGELLLAARAEGFDDFVAEASEEFAQDGANDEENNSDNDAEFAIVGDFGVNREVEEVAKIRDSEIEVEVLVGEFETARNEGDEANDGDDGRREVEIPVFDEDIARDQGDDAERRQEIEQD